MSRTSSNEMVDGVVKDGFDYNLQVWIKDYKIILAGSQERTTELEGRDIRQLAQN